MTARVQILVPVSLTGRLDTPSPDTSGRSDGAFQPELVGVGPLDTDTATRIMHDTPTWDMIIVDDTGTGTRTGCPNCIDPGTRTNVGTNVDGYRVPASLRRYLAARDEHCRFPGCALPVHRCDIDHTIAAEDGGPTASTNLGYLCRGHHTMKHHGGLHPEQHPQGDFTWTLPSGRQYITKPPSTVTFVTALTRPDIPRLIAENLKQHPYGMSDWDDPPDTPGGAPTEPEQTDNYQRSRSEGSPPSSGPPPF